MKRSADQHGLIKRILGNTHGAVGLFAPADGGKTTLAREAFLEAMDREGKTAVWLAPNTETVRRVQMDLLDSCGRNAWMGSAVMTFADLSKRILACDPQAGRSLPNWHTKLILERLVGQLAESGELETLENLVGAPGLVSALSRSISELKRSAVDPEAFSKAAAGTEPKNIDLAKIYQRYQEELVRKNVYDIEGELWRARDRLTGTCGEPDAPLGMGEASGLVVDGFTDFNPTQLQILRLLSQRLDWLCITLPFPAEGDGRKRMWAWSRRSAEKIRDTFGDELDEIHLPVRCEEGIGVLGRNVFEDEPQSLEPPEGLNILAAAGTDDLLQAVARRIRDLLDDPACGRIVVMARSLTAWRESIGRIFRAFEIPHRGSPLALSDSPVIRFFLSVASLPVKDFCFSDVLGVIRNSYFVPNSLGNFDADTVFAAEYLIRESNVISGRDAYSHAVQKIEPTLSHEDDERNDDDEEKHESHRPISPALISAGQMLEALFDLATKCSDAKGFLQAIETLKLESASWRLPDPLLSARDLRSLESLAEILKSPDGPSNIQELSSVLSETTLPTPRGPRAVDVLDVLDARAIRWDHVFLLDCGEKEFPLPGASRALLGEAYRRDLVERGLNLDRRDDLDEREMLLFYLGVTRGQRSVTFCFRTTDSDGRSAAPGAFLEALAEPLGGLESLKSLGKVKILPPGQFTPPPDQFATRDEQFRVALAGLFNDEIPPVEGAGEILSSFPNRLKLASCGLWCQNRRWTPGPADEFDGRLGDTELCKSLRDPEQETVFSASQLGVFGRCPWKYFAQYILNLKEPSRPDRDLQAISVGLYCHEVLSKTFQRLAEEHGLPVRLADIPHESIALALQEACDTEAANIEKGGVQCEALWAGLLEKIHQDLGNYLQDQRDDPILGSIDPESLEFELAFGMEGETPPVEISIPDGPVFRLRGRIDRIDRATFEGKSGLLVVDYKSGSLPSGPEIDKGVHPQIPLYLRAAEEILDEPLLGGSYDSVRKKETRRLASFKPSQKKKKMVPEKKNFQERLDGALAAVGRSVENIREGHFDLNPFNKKVCKYCSFRRICHYASARSAVKGMGGGAS